VGIRQACMDSAHHKALTHLSLMSKYSLMARPVTISTDRIVEVARSLFLEHGAALSTAIIARELGISEGSIYKRFETKNALFSAAMGLPSVDFSEAWSGFAGEETVHRNLLTMGERLVMHFRETLPRIFMVRRNARVDPLHMLEKGSAPPVLLLDRVTAYLAAETKGNRMALPDPRVAARMFVGAIINYVFFEVMGFEEHTEDETQQMLEGLVSLLLRGGQP
jgi:AcrR family transcriptional regulator